MLKSTLVVLRLTEMSVLAAALLVVLATLSGCGDSDPKCATISCGTGGSAGSGGAGGSGGSGMPIMVNGCDSSMAIDKTNDATTMISFAGIEYTPHCVRIHAGSMVVFSGTFTSHPLVGGTVNGSTVTPDASSPLPATSSGSELTIPLSKAGAVPYYCSLHASSGMMGAIFVE